jgi:trimeric autotransporter adhesin
MELVGMVYQAGGIIMKKKAISLLIFILLLLQIAQMKPVWAKISEPLIPQRTTAQSNLIELPMPAQEAVSAALGRDDTTYHVSGDSEVFQARNAAQGLAMDFSQETVHFRAGESVWGLRLEDIGCGNNVRLPEASPVRIANGLEYNRGLVKEWYLNGPLGLEQGFTVSSRPSGKGSSPLTLGFSMSGNLKPWVDKDQRGLSLTKEDGSKVLSYRGLRAHDSTRKELDTWLEMNGNRLWVRVKDDQAIYPVTIDPLVQQAKLTGSTSSFGYSVTLSGDGNTLLIGAQDTTVNGRQSQGAAYVFTRSGTNWYFQAQLTTSDGAVNDQFGSSVSLSSDGNTALVGAISKTLGGNDHQGVAYIFTRSGSVWSQQQELTASDGEAGDQFGYSVSLSGDGNTALIGPSQKSNGGEVYIFTRSGSVWSQQQVITASDRKGGDRFGNSVALSDDGQTALIGAYGNVFNNNYMNSGAAYVFTRTNSVWSQQQKLTASDSAQFDRFGYSVSLSGDGENALIGAPFKTIAHQYGGAAYLFTRAGNIWSQQQELTAADSAENDMFGRSVSLNGDGWTALIGAPYKTVNGYPVPGTAYVFTRSGSVWSQQQELTASDGTAGDQFGSSLSLSSDGNTALIGSHRRAAYVFSDPSNPCSFILHPSNQFMSSAGGTGIVNVTTASGCAWTATESLDWVTILSGSGGTGNGTLTYSVSSNTIAKERTGNINIAGKIFTITQEGRKALPWLMLLLGD